ncbi:hypothetical protein [Sinorhizobium medicae]|uniref:hypothetical protein n=1 Tax=Sinorhizobium medicae TaxID=110321 RepID=UPI0004242E16|nr:hypothetical protein [Sinorhizobium medicae]
MPAATKLKIVCICRASWRTRGTKPACRDYAGAVTIPEATHYVHLDRPERRRGRLLAEVIRTLAQTAVAKAAH